METMETKVNTTNETESAAHQTGMMDINDFDYDLPEELIAQGKVKVNGRVVTEMGLKIDPEKDEVSYLDRKISKKDTKLVYLMLHKPVGYVTTAKEQFGRTAVVDLIKGVNARIFPVGRLDYDTSGLLLLTNDGELINSMMRARYHHEKEYHVRVDKEITSEFVRQMSEGVHIQDVEKNLDAVTRPCEVKQIGKYTFSIILTQGLNRQIRRMCEALGYKVTKLVRIRIMNVELGSLKSGAVRKIEGQELKKLYEQAGTHEGTGGAFE